MSSFSCQGSCLLLGVGCCGDRRELSNEKIVGDMSCALGLMHAEFVLSTRSWAGDVTSLFSQMYQEVHTVSWEPAG